MTHYVLQTGNTEPQLHGPFPSHTERDEFLTGASSTPRFAVDVRFLTGEVVLDLRAQAQLPQP